MAETLSTISLISFLAAGVFAILAVILWFVFRIPTVAGELSGRIAKKSIERMRKSNEEAGKNSRGPGAVMREGKKSSPYMIQTEKNRIGGENAETDLLAESAARMHHSRETEALTDKKDTGSLGKSRKERRVSSVKIDLLKEILLIHTKEVIE